MRDHCRWLSLDVGGANIKAAHSGGDVFVTPFELWKQPERLAEELQRIAVVAVPFDRVALTMTAELCDCFETKAQGVRHVLDAVCTLRPAGDVVVVWGVDGQFHTVEEVRLAPHIAAAANWLALATVAAQLVPEGTGILIDVGSTTTDVIPLRDGRASPTGRSDVERLQTGELLYVGARRTPLCAIASHIFWRGRSIGMCAELFATVHDVYLVLGDIAEDLTDSHTADGRPATRAAAQARLARMVGCDRSDLDEQDLTALARAIDARMVRRLIGGARRATGAVGTPRTAVIAGSGAFLARRVASALGCAEIVDLEVLWKRDASTAACAVAMLQLVARGAYKA